MKTALDMIPQQPGAKFNKALADLDKAERDLRRAFNRWDKKRLKVQRMERKLARGPI